MSKLINIITPHKITLDDLYREAERYGKVKLDNTWFGGEYEVEIHLNHETHYITVRGKHKDKYIAFQKAIEEAVKYSRVK